MATSDATISYIPSTNVGISDANVLKNLIANSKYNQGDSSLKALRDWFRDYVGVRGDANDETLTTGISLGNFGQNYIYGFSVYGKPEGARPLYQDANTGSVTFQGLYGISSTQNFTISLGGSTLTTTRGVNVTFGGLSGKPDNPQVPSPQYWRAPAASNDYLDYASSIYHRSTTDKIDFTIRIGYSGVPCRFKYGSIDDDITDARSYLVGTTIYKFGEKLGGIPAAPSGLAAVATTANSIILEWSPVFGADSYEVYRNNSLIAAVTTATYTDSGLTSKTAYKYRIRAKNTFGNSSFSAESTFTTSSLATSFRMLMRISDSDINNNAASTDTWNAIILDDYTNYSYVFNVTITLANGTTTATGNHAVKTYDYNIALADTINYKTLAGGTATPQEYKSIRLNSVTATPRDGGSASTFNVGQVFSFNAEGVDVTAVTVTNPAEFQITSTDYIVNESTTTGVYTNIVAFNLGLNLDPSRREEWTITPASASATEGTALNFNTLAYNATGSYYWAVKHASTAGTSAADFSSVSGLISPPNADNGTGSFSITPLDDGIADAAERFSVEIRKGSATGTVMATSSLITVADGTADVLNFTLTQTDGDVWKVYIDGNKNATYAITYSYGTTRTGSVLSSFNPSTTKTAVRYNSGNSGEQRFNIETIALKNGATTVKTWDIQKRFYSPNNINQTSEAKFTISDITGTTNPDAVYEQISNDADGVNLCTSKFKITLS